MSSATLNIEPSHLPRKGAAGPAGRAATRSQVGGPGGAVDGVSNGGETFDAILPVVGSGRSAMAGVTPAAAGAKRAAVPMGPGPEAGPGPKSPTASATADARLLKASPLVGGMDALSDPHAAAAIASSHASAAPGLAEPASVPRGEIEIGQGQGGTAPTALILQAPTEAGTVGGAPLPPLQPGVVASGTMAGTGRPAPGTHEAAILHRLEGAAHAQSAARAGTSLALPANPPIGSPAGAAVPAGAAAGSPAGGPAVSWSAAPTVPPGPYRVPRGGASSPMPGASPPAGEHGARTRSPESRIDVAGQIDVLAAAPRGAGSVAPPATGIVPSVEPGRTQGGPAALVSDAVHAMPEGRGASPEAAQARAASAAPMMADPYMNVRAQIANVRLSEGRTRVELTPRGLGDIEIDLRQEGGQLRVVLRVENPAVLAGLRQDREGIVAMLRDGGVDLGDGALGFESFDGHRPRGQPAPGGQDPAYGRTASPWEMAEDAVTEAEAPVDAVPRAAGPASRLDLIT